MFIYPNSNTGFWKRCFTNSITSQLRFDQLNVVFSAGVSGQRSLLRVDAEKDYPASGKQDLELAGSTGKKIILIIPVSDEQVGKRHITGLCACPSSV